MTSYFRLKKFSHLNSFSILKIPDRCILQDFTFNISFPSLCSRLGPPDSPSISNLTVHGNNCSLQWTEPYNGKSPITMYTIHVWKIIVYLNGSLFWKKIKTWNTTKTLSLMLNLEWNQNYTVAVSAWNKYGIGSSSIKERCEIGRGPPGSDCLLL